jgi:hypothetical protein
LLDSRWADAVVIVEPPNLGAVLLVPESPPAAPPVGPARSARHGVELPQAPNGRQPVATPAFPMEL